MLIRAAALTALAAGLTPPALASSTPVTYCFRWSTDYDDANASVGDDFWISASPRAARGGHVTIGEATYPGGLLFSGYLPVSGSQPGCVTVGVDTSKTYSVTLSAKAQINGNVVQVHPHRDTTAVPGYIQFHSPSKPGTLYVTYPTSPASSVIAAASYTQFRRTGGVSGETYRVYLDGCGGLQNGQPSNSSCVSGDDIHIGASHYSLKYLIVHELAHVLLKYAKGDHSSGSNLDLPEDGECPGGGGHLMNSKEYLPAAIWEGFAHYYAALIWNRDTEADCRFQYYKPVNWDLNSVPPYNPWQPSTHNYIDCEAGAHDGGLTVAAADYYSLGPGTGDSCEGTFDSYRGTTYDWLRHLWDLTTQDGPGVDDLSFNQVVDLLVEADVGHGWDNISNTDWTTACPAITSCIPAAQISACSTVPSYRLAMAARCLGHEDAWDHALNGPEANRVDR